MNKVVIKTGMWIFVWTYFYFSLVNTSIGIVGSWGLCMANFRNPTDGRNFHILRYGEVMLTYIWFNLDFKLTKQPDCGPLNLLPTSALTVKQRNACTNQNGATTVLAFRMELRSHCGHSCMTDNLHFRTFIPLRDAISPLKTIPVRPVSSNHMLSSLPL